MSEYIKTKIQCGYAKELIQALEDVYGIGTVVIHETPVNLYDYRANQRPEKANIIVRRHNVGKASNDLGFVKNSDGSYTMIWSAYDKSSKHVNPQKIMNRYVEHVVKNRYRMKYRIRNSDENGIKLQVIGG